MAKDNRTLGKFQLAGIPPAPRGVPQIEVTFDIDANGIVNVSAKDRGTGKSQAITITASSGLAKDEVERMVNDAQAHEEEDKANREAIEAKNRADGLVYGAEKFLSENKDKLSEADDRSRQRGARAGAQGHRGRRQGGDRDGRAEPREGAAQAGRGAVPEERCRAAAPAPRRTAAATRSRRAATT